MHWKMVNEVTWKSDAKWCFWKDWVLEWILKVHMLTRSFVSSTDRKNALQGWDFQRSSAPRSFWSNFDYIQCLKWIDGHWMFKVTSGLFPINSLLQWNKPYLSQQKTYKQTNKTQNKTHTEIPDEFALAERQLSKMLCIAGSCFKSALVSHHWVHKT